HVFAGLGSLDRPLRVAGMRCGDIDRIDVRIIQQRLVATEDAGLREIGLEAWLVRIARGDGFEFAVLGIEDAAAEILGDGARPDDAPAQGGSVRRHVDAPPKLVLSRIGTGKTGLSRSTLRLAARLCRSGGRMQLDRL